MSITKKNGSRDRGARRGISDRTLNRLIVGLVVALLIGVPVIAITYYADRHVDGGPSMSQRAVNAAEEAVRNDPNLLSARMALAAAYANDNRPADAIAQYDIVLQTEPGSRAALLGRGDAYRANSDLDSAALDYQALIDAAKDEEMAAVDRQLEAAYYGLGFIQFQQNKARDAAVNLANALVIDRTDADALDLMGRSLIAIGDYDSAIDALHDAVALVPTGWCDPYDHLAEAYQAKSDADGAAYASGMVALCEDRPDDAQQALEPLVEGAYGRDALIGLALTAEKRGDTAAAANYYEQVYAQNPSDFAAITGLARVGGQASPATPPVATPAASLEP